MAMGQDQRSALDAMLRDAPLDLGGDVAEQRRVFAEMMEEVPLPPDLTPTACSLGGVPAVRVEPPGADPDRLVFYVHGGAFCIGSAASSVGLAADLARRAGAAVVSIDYRLAPEHPHPAAIHDTVAAYAALLETRPAEQVAIAGESAGGGLVIATLLALRDHGLALPAAAVVMSPWVDLTLSGASTTTKAEADPTLTATALRRRAADYAPDGDLSAPLLSPLFADLAGLPPLLIQVGTHEILLDDATRLARAAAAADVAVTLQVTPGVPHIFQGFASLLEEGDRALTAAGAFVRAHVAGNRRMPSS